MKVNDRFGSRSFEAIYDEAQRVGWPVHFESDLWHDQHCATVTDGRSFLWCLRDSGTHFIPTDVEDWNTDRMAEGLDHFFPSQQVKAIRYNWCDERCRWYAWDGHSLRAIDSTKAERMAADATHRIGLALKRKERVI